MQRSNIEWCDFTSNPLKYRTADGRVVWGCVHKSPGCQKCYAETLARRYGRGGPFNIATMAGLTPFLDDKELHHMLTYKPASGKMCFVGDMTDIFGEWVPDELIYQVFAVFALRSDVVWQVLTKRAARMRAIVEEMGDTDQLELEMSEFGDEGMDFFGGQKPRWPLPNVRLGVSVENQQTADERIPDLLATPAACRFVSYEPALGPVDFAQSCRIADFTPFRGGCGIHQIIVGGESGPGARPLEVDWLRSTRNQCRKASIALFVKQYGSRPVERIPGLWERWTGRWTSMRGTALQDTHVRLLLRDRKGSDIAEWQEDLRVRMQPGEKWA